MSQVGRQHGRRAALVLASLLAAVPAAAQPRAYLVEGDALAVVDLDARQVLDRIPLLAPVADLAVSPDGETAYAVGYHLLQVVDLGAGRVRGLHRIWGEDPPDGRITLSPTGDRAYLSSTQPGGGGSWVEVFDTAAGAFAPAIDLPTLPDTSYDYLHDFAVTADGRRAHALLEVEHRDAGFSLLLREIDLAIGAVMNERPVVTAARHFGSGIVLAEEGQAIVGSERGLLAIDLASAAVVAESAGPAWAWPQWDPVRRQLYAWSWSERGGRETQRLHAVDLERGRRREVAQFRGWVSGLELLPERGVFTAHLPGPPARTVLLDAESGRVIDEVPVAGPLGAVAFGAAAGAPVLRPTPRPSPTAALPATAQVLAIDGERRVLAEIDSAAPAVARLSGDVTLGGVRGVSVAADGRRLYAITYLELLLRDLDGTAGGERIAFDDSGSGLSAVAAAPDGATVWVAQHGSLHAVDAPAPHGRERLELNGPVSDLAFSPDGRTLFAVGGDGYDGQPGTLHIVDPVARRLRAAVAVPGGATAAAVAGGRVFITGDDDTVAVVDAAAGAVEAVIPVPREPQALAASGDGARVYVAGGTHYSDEPPTLSVIDTATLRREATVQVATAGRIRDLLLTPDGQRALLTIEQGPTRTVVVDLARLEVVGTLPVGGLLAIGQPTWSAPATPTPLPRQTPGARRPCMLLPHGVGPQPLDGTITLVDPLAHAVAGSIRVGGLSSDTTYGEVYDGVAGVAADPLGHRIYALLWPYAGGSTWLVAIDARRRIEVARLPVGAYAGNLVISPDGARAFVQAGAGDVRTLISVDLRAWRVLDEVALEPTVWRGPFLAADGARLFLRGYRYQDGEMVPTLVAVDADTLRELFVLPLPANAAPYGGIAALPDGRRLLVDITAEGSRRERVAVVDLERVAVTSIIDLPVTSWGEGGRSGSGFVVAPDGSEVYRLAGGQPSVVTVFDADDLSIVAQVPDLEALHGGAVTPDGAFVYANAGWPGDLAVFDIAQRRRIATVGIGSYAGGVVAAEIDGDCEPLAVPWTPTATPTAAPETPATATPTVSPPPTWSGFWQEVVLAPASGEAGATVAVDVRLEAAGVEVAGVQADIAFAPPLEVAADAQGQPRCRINAAIDKPASVFAFLPQGCHGGTCRSLRALVFSLTDVAPITDGSVLYTCEVTIAADAVAGDYPLRVTEVGASDPIGNALPALGRSGTVTVNAAVGHRSSTSGGGDGACAVVEPSAAGGAWWPIGAALALASIRRRPTADLIRLGGTSSRRAATGAAATGRTPRQFTNRL